MPSDDHLIRDLRQLLARKMWGSVLERTRDIHLDSDNTQILSARAIALVETGDLDAGIELWTRCFGIDQAGSQIRRDVSSTLMNQLRLLSPSRDRDRSTKIIKLLSVLGARDPAVWRELAITARDRGLIDVYIRCMNRANELDS